MDDKIIHYNTAILIVLKELRRSFTHQATLAEACGKSLSAWNKIESGKIPLSMALFRRICYHFSLQPFSVLWVVDKIATFFKTNGYAVIYNEDNIDGDTIINKVNSYYKEHAYETYQCPHYYSNPNHILFELDRKPPQVVIWCLERMQQGGHNE